MDLKVSQKKQAGFSLLEIIIVLAILGILMATGIPTFLQWLPGYRLRSATRDIQTTFQSAKLEAVQRRLNVAIVFTAGAYAPAGGIGSYTVFADANSNLTYDAAVDVLIKTITMPSNVSLTAAAPLAVAFSSRGIPSAATTVTMRNNKGVFAQIDTNLTGRVRMQRSTDGGTTYLQWD